MHERLGLTASKTLPSHQFLPGFFGATKRFSLLFSQEGAEAVISLSSPVLVCDMDYFFSTVALTILNR